MTWLWTETEVKQAIKMQRSHTQRTIKAGECFVEGTLKAVLTDFSLKRHHNWSDHERCIQGINIPAIIRLILGKLSKKKFT